MSPKSEEEKRQMEKFPIWEVIGSLMYLMGMTRADIAYAVNQVAQFVSNSGRGHWKAIKQILAFLSGKTHHGISFGGPRMKAESPLIVYSYADLAADLIDD